LKLVWAVGFVSLITDSSRLVRYVATYTRGIRFLKNNLDTHQRRKLACCVFLPYLTPRSRVLLEKLISLLLIIEFLWARIAQSI
jgi:hypothetical protein